MSHLRRKILTSLLIAGLGFVLIVIACGGQVGSSTRKSTLMMGLIHRWQFDGDASDSMGNLSANAQGPVAYTDVGEGQGIVLNGTTTGISLPPAKDMQFQGSFSISVWAKLDARPPSSQMWSSIIFDGDDRAGFDPYALQADPKGNIHFLVTGWQNNLGEIEAPLPLHTFVFLTASYDKTTGAESIYEDGKLVNQTVGNTTYTPVVQLVEHQNAGIGIGTNNGFPNSNYHFGWKGVLSDLRIYNRTLTPDEVVELYHLGVTHSKNRINPVINP